MRRSLGCMAAVLASLASGAWLPSRAAGEAPAPAKLLPAGDASAAWVLRLTTRPDAYDLVAKPAGGEWQWVAHALQGRPVTAAALGDQLHVLLADREYVIFDLDSGRSAPGIRPNHPRWPDTATVLAACPSGPIAGVTGARTIIVVLSTPVPASRPAASRPATTSGPATTSASAPARAGESLAIFCLQGGRWTFLDDVPAPAGKVLAASLDGQLYLLLCPPGAAQILVRDRTGAWLPPRALPDLLPAGYEPLAFAAVKDSLLLARRHKDPAATRPAADEVSLLTIEKDLRVSVASPVSLPPGQPMGEGVQALPFAEGLALIWPHAPAPVFVRCAPTAAVTGVETIGLFAKAPNDGRGEQALAYAVYVLFALFIGCTFLRIRRGRVIFTLPMGVRPARLGRRVVAAIIDLLPFLFLGYALFPFPLPESGATPTEIREFLLKQPADLNAALFVIATWLVHGIYCVGMESQFGATLGKRIFGLRVVGAGGRQALFFEILYRAILRVVELALPGLVLGLACVLLTRYHQRFGDLLAQTAVVEGTPTPTFPQGQQQPPPLPPNNQDPPPPPPT
ncbi:MAG: RDD family protein [Planctomycetota bacterium]|nr:RDD family protein [Planctomycetota bacterium]